MSKRIHLRTISASSASLLYNGTQVARTTDIDRHPSFQQIGGSNPSNLYPRGFGQGDHFFAKTDAAGRVVPEADESVRVFYFADGGLTKQDIEGSENRSIGAIQNWIISQGTAGLAVSPNRYGETEALALDKSLMNSVIGQYWTVNGHAAPCHVYLRGGDTFNSFPRPTRAASPLHPTILTTYGTGKATISDPSLSSITNLTQNWILENLVFDQTPLRITSANPCKNMQLHRCENTGFGASITFRGNSANRLNRVTISDHLSHGVRYSEPKGYGTGTGFWMDANADRVEAVYLAHIDGMLIVDSSFDLNSFDPNYSSDRSYPPGQIPTQFSHNVYGGESIQDWTNQRVISSRAANSGMQIRTGSYNVDVVFAECNIAHQISGASPPDLANHTALIDQWIIGAGAKRTDPPPTQGYSGRDQFQNWDAGVNWGIGSFFGYDQPMFGLYVLNGSDPNNPDEVSRKGTSGGRHIDLSDPSDADRFRIRQSVVWNWFSQPNYGFGGLVPAELNECTLAHFVDDYRSQTAGTTQDADAALDFIVSLERPSDLIAEIHDYMAPRLGLPQRKRSAAETLTFVPHGDADGFRWANRHNWSTGSVAGEVAGDSANLNGNTVVDYEPRRLVNLDFGTTGGLRRTGGFAAVAGAWTGTGELYVGPGAHFHVEGTVSGRKLATLDEGRLAIDTDVNGDLSVAASSWSELVVMGNRSLVISASETLSLDGNARVIFDGASGSNSLTLAGDLVFSASAGSLGTISKGISGIYGLGSNGRPAAPGIASSVIMGGNLTIDVSGIAPNTYTLILADSLSGYFDNVTVVGGSGIVSVDTTGGTVTVTVT